MSLSDIVLQRSKSTVLQRFHYSNITVIRIARFFRPLRFCYDIGMHGGRAIEQKKPIGLVIFIIL